MHEVGARAVAQRGRRVRAWKGGSGLERCTELGSVIWPFLVGMPRMGASLRRTASMVPYRRSTWASGTNTFICFHTWNVHLFD